MNDLGDYDLWTQLYQRNKDKMTVEQIKAAGTLEEFFASQITVTFQ